MTTYNTFNPVPSKDPKDLIDNAENVDVAMNSTGSTWTDRFGVTRKTFKAAENAADAAEAAANTAINTEIPAEVARVTADANTAIGTEIPFEVNRAKSRADTAVDTEIPAQVQRAADYVETILEPETSDALNVSVAKSALRAEAARDAAFINAEVYDDIPAGLASGDEQFLVVGGTEVVRYRNESGGAVEVARYPSASGVVAAFGYDEKKSGLQSFDGYEWAVLGRNGNPYLSIEKGSDGVRGVFESYHGIEFFHPIYAQAATLRGELAYGVTHDGSFVGGGAPLLDSDYLKAYADHESGRVLYGVRHDGSFDAGTGVRGKSFAYTWGDKGSRQIRAVGEKFEEKIIAHGGDNWSPQIEAGNVVYLTDINGPTEIASVELDPENPFSPFVDAVEFWLSTGQSLDVGSTTPPITVKPPLPGIVLTLNHGVRLDDSDAIKPEEIAALKPCAANISEPPIVSQCVNARELFINNDALGIVCATYSSGGRRIDQLSKGTRHYSNAIAAITSAFNITSDLGLPLITPFVSYRQGEADISDDTSATDYENALLQLQSDYEADIQAITGQTSGIPILLDQVSSQTHYNQAESDIPLVQLDIALQNPTLFTCVGPKYDIEYRDGVHVYSDGFFKIGAKFAQAAAALSDGGTWLPVHATNAEISGTVVTVTFACPNGKLTIDDQLVSDPGNYGVRWLDNGDGNSPSVTSVSITSDNTLTVELDMEPTGTGGKIGIADIGIATNPAGPTTGARSCLRDDSPINDINGDPIYHWACHQQINVTEV